MQITMGKFKEEFGTQNPEFHLNQSCEHIFKKYIKEVNNNG